MQASAPRYNLVAAALFASAVALLSPQGLAQDPTRAQAVEGMRLAGSAKITHGYVAVDGVKVFYRIAALITEFMLAKVKAAATSGQ